jgi:hypothetical protein
VSVVHVQQGVVFHRDAGERADVGRIARHGVHSIHGDHPREPGVARREQLLQMRGVVVTETDDLRSVTGCNHRAVIDRLVGSSVKEDRPVAHQDRDHGHVDMRDGR